MQARLALLSAVRPGLPESEIFRLGLLHATAELCALGGMVHLCGPTSALCLASTVGLPQDLPRSWEVIDQESQVAPARALHQGSTVWLPPPSDEPAAATQAAEAADTADVPWPGMRTGLAVLPVSAGGRIMGTLTVLTGDRGEPTPEEWDFLRSVVAWTEERMVQAPKVTAPAASQPDGERPQQTAVPDLMVGWWDWNLQTDELIWDALVMEYYGTKPADYTGRIQDWIQILHPDDLAPTLQEAQRAIREHSIYEATYRVRHLDGTYGWSRARGKPTYDDQGAPLRMVGVRWESSESPSARDALSRALRHMSDGFLTVDAEWRIIFANLEAERLLGHSQEELFGRVLWDLPAAQRIPGLERRCRRAAAEEIPASFDVDMPDTGRRYQLRLVPGPVGRAIYLADVTEKRRMQEEREAAERAASERAAQIAELTAALAKATTTRDVVDAVAQRVLPPFDAVGLVVQAIEGNQLIAIGAVGYADDFLDVLNSRSTAATLPGWSVIASGAPVFLSSPQEYVAYSPDHADLPGIARKQAWAFMPLTVSDQTFGVCVVSWDRPRRLDADERSLLTTISALVAQALERARLYDAEHTRSRELQRSLLPRDLPDLPACTAAARYLPAGQGMDVGGDWYDVIPLSSGQVALVVGDVMGHGLPEAATMGRLRTAVHTLADLELPPDEIMGHLNDIVGGMSEDSYVTCLYALYDSTTQNCSIARAGHPPPALVHPDGTVHFPEPAADPPLGTAKPPFETVELTVPDGSLLVLYTDGLVESAKREVDEGMSGLARLLRTAHDEGIDADLETLCDTLTAGLLSGEHQAADDAALLVARLHALTEDRMASWPLPEDPKAAGLARRHVREQLSDWGLDELTPTTELLASEMVGNVVRHAKGPMRLRLLHDTRLVCEVFDGSLTMPRIRHATETDEGGRGLQLITALSQRWGARYTPNGKCIWTEQTLLGPDGRLDRPSDTQDLLFLNPEGFAGDLDALSFESQEQ
ncbi:SpoIIE family protein phosphatase [Streptomyces acidicola]|uniref:protein-serine/threonine phosphatase n=1 Tax=Streptomyces acidicola TaxID=2596892 RepID=A0A5N8WW03_9ACTN|nr:SpoIIE family protein phosphatase [Streptomyces acidicola]MPY51583.1 SpoIIE family protein phosphatase [Streptomyces acidicola]